PHSGTSCSRTVACGLLILKTTVYLSSATTSSTVRYSLATPDLVLGSWILLTQARTSSATSSRSLWKSTPFLSRNFQLIRSLEASQDSAISGPGSVPSPVRKRLL